MHLTYVMSTMVYQDLLSYGPHANRPSMYDTYIGLMGGVNYSEDDLGTNTASTFDNDLHHRTVDLASMPNAPDDKT